MNVEAITFDNFRTLTYGKDTSTDVVPYIIEGLEARVGKIKGFFDVYRRLDERYMLERDITHRETRINDIIVESMGGLGYPTSGVYELIDEVFEDYLEERGYNWYPDVFSTVENLREEGFKLGLISNIHWPIPSGLRKSLDAMFDTVTYSHIHGMRKPHPAIFLDTLEEMGAEPRTSAHVGDDYGADVIGAKNAGMIAVHLQRGEKREAEKADAVITSLDELENIFSRYIR